ncbi:DUF3800 domain-containing protein [Corynebacterium oculi]|nr:DUF3800 domain-containing protein [Corynebacterium oculi]
MHVAYLDETFHPRKEHSVLALVSPMDQIPLIEENLNAALERISKQHHIPSTVELHGYELSSGTRDWEPLTTPRARTRIYKQAISAITHVPDLAICRGTTSLAEKSPHDPHKWSLTFTLECIDTLMKRKNDRVLAFCDDVQNKSIYQDMYASFRRNGLPDDPTNKLTSFTDGLHFTPSHHSRMVQAIDLISYVYRRNFIQKYTDPRAHKVFENLWKELEPLAQRGYHRTW